MSTISTVEHLFVSLLGRPGDRDGVQFWTGILDQGRANVSAVTDAIVQSSEFQKHVAGKSSAGIVDLLYKNMFGHAASQAAAATWASQLDKGVGIGQVVGEIAKAAQGSDLIALEAKTAAATAFTQALLTPDQISGYGAPRALDYAVAYLDYVHDAGTLTVATRPYALKEAVDSVVKGVDWQVPDNIEQQMQELYVAYFSRPADPAGLAYWSSMLDGDANNPQLALIAAQFGQSSEYRNLYSQATSQLKVGAIYQHLFGRDAESAGLAFWSTLLDAGKLDIDKIVATISASARGSDKTVLDYKVDVAGAVTAAIDTPWETASYHGAWANQLVTAYIGTIKDAASYAAAITPAAIDALIISFSENHGPLPPAASGDFADISLIGIAAPIDGLHVL